MRVFSSFRNRSAQEDGTQLGRVVVGIIIAGVLISMLVVFFMDIYNPGRDILQKTSEDSIQKQNESIKGN